MKIFQQVNERMAPAKKINYQQIAKLAKVSIASVSRVANGNPNVDTRIQERIRQSALKLGIELQGRRKSNKVLAFILSNRAMLHSFHSHVLVGAEAASTTHGYNMLFLRFDYVASKSSRELQLPPLLESTEQVAGFILAGTTFPNLLDLLSRHRLPFVVLGNNVCGEWSPGQHDVVWFDDIQGAYEMTQYLIGLGHRDIWFIGNCSLPWYARRYEGYRRAMEKAGLHPCLSQFDSPDNFQTGYLATKSILTRNPPVSAIFAGGDADAQGACKALNENGLRVPEHVSVAGFDDIIAATWQPPLTTVQVFPEQISRHMVDLLVKRIANPDVAPQCSVIPSQLIKRESCDRLLMANQLVGNEHQVL